MDRRPVKISLGVDTLFSFTHLIQYCLILSFGLIHLMVTTASKIALMAELLSYRKPILNKVYLSLFRRNVIEFLALRFSSFSIIN